MRNPWPIVVLTIVAVVVLAWRDVRDRPKPTVVTSLPVTTEHTDTTVDPVLVGAGDIASCGNDHDEATAKLLDAIPGTIFTLGDNVYPDGTPEEFERCYGPTWGRHRDRTRPAPGNHDYRTADAEGYFQYFGERAGDPSKGYYSYDLGSWHVIVLNSNCGEVGGCGRGSPQYRWLIEDLEEHRPACTVAYMHHPRFSSGIRRGTPTLQSLWEALYRNGIDLALAGHHHAYERLAPMDDQGASDPAQGIRSFVVGTGGRSRYPFSFTLPTSEVRDNTSYGVLKLTLHDGSYDWEYLPAKGAAFSDAGSSQCH